MSRNFKFGNIFVRLKNENEWLKSNKYRKSGFIINQYKIKFRRNFYGKQILLPFLRR